MLRIMRKLFVLWRWNVASVSAARSKVKRCVGVLWKKVKKTIVLTELLWLEPVSLMI